jgi:hypothetical protein
MNKKKPIDSAAQFFRVAPAKYKKAIKEMVVKRGYTEAYGPFGLSTHLYESFGIWVTGKACEELIRHYLNFSRKGPFNV